MIKVTSNIDGFIEAYKKRIKLFENKLNKIAKKLAKRMVDDMEKLIKEDKRWQEHGNLSRIDKVDFRIESISTQSVKVYVGEKLPKFEMTDGEFVNPAYFIEFGFGIVGQEKPKINHDKYGWEYNIHDYKESWLFFYDGILMESSGREGINFIHNTVQKYRDNWKVYLKELMEQEDGTV